MKLVDDMLLPRVPKNATVRDAAKEMKRTDFGAVLIQDGHNVVGLITDRDIVIRVLADDTATLDTPVYEFRTPEMITCKTTDSLEAAAKLMEKHQVRYLLVLNEEGEATGLASLDVIAQKVDKTELVGDVVASGHRDNEQRKPNAGETAPIAKG